MARSNKRPALAVVANADAPPRPHPTAVVHDIPLGQIEPDPGQPRKTFAHLGELARSIKANGLLQPITVRRVGEHRYWIVAGERRFRASQMNEAPTIRALVIEPKDEAETRVLQIIENDVRDNVSPLEQARSYRELMDRMGWTVEELAARIGKAPHRITERTDLLKLAPEYQDLLASGNLKPSEAYEMARLSARGQVTLFKSIQSGACRNYNDLRSTANAILRAESQLSLLPDPEPATEDEKQEATAFERHVERIATLLNSGIQENQIVAVRKTRPDRASYFADLLRVMQRDLRRIEIALREAAIQADFLAFESEASRKTRSPAEVN